MNIPAIHTETPAQKQQRALKIVKILEKTFPNAHCELDHKNPFELLIAVVLSAQSTDKNTNKVTRELFQVIKTPRDLAEISQAALENLVHSTGFFRQKAKNLREAAKLIVERFGGSVPRTMAEITALPGVARKTANIILETGFGVIEGIAVDTHVKRIANRLGLTVEQNPDKIERDLLAVFSRPLWGKINHLFVWHGRRICLARAPKCSECPLFPLCPGRKGV